ncbi:hypothetical protein D9757_009054 [Collybiopsis confluens]|uniref:Uncharacterized protein n=1 Tax=Collybiopsis confluens TaxID=2823264 RepID=A0A8H5M5H1_9AGAR|nr:hypothetical protein D9757_009054 [Collybiopsis confluens]
MPNLPFDMSQNAIEILAQHVVSGLNAFAQKIGVQDDEPMLERLRRGEYRLAPSSLSEINPLFEEGVSRLIELDQSIAKIEDAMQRLKRTRTCFEGSLTIPFCTNSAGSGGCFGRDLFAIHRGSGILFQLDDL